MSGLSWSQLIAVVLVVAGVRPVLVALGCPEAFASRGPQLLALAAYVGVVMHLRADDPPRRPWMLLSLANALVLAAALVRALAPVELANARWTLLVAGNIVGPLGMFAFARLLGGSGLAPALDRPTRFAVVGVATIATVHALAAIAARAAELTAPIDTRAIVDFSGWSVLALGDAASLGFAGLVVARLRGMAGAALARPYLVIALASGLFLALDVVLALGGVDGYAALAPALLHLPALAWGLGAGGALALIVLVRQARARTSIEPEPSRPAAD
jgi:hypothetical protein